MSSQSTGNEEELDENKIDFDLLNKRRRDQTSDASSDSSTILSDTTNYSKTSEVWPLHLTPRFIDHYIAGDLIGSGSYAEVRECVDTRTLERCALKIVNKEYLVRQAPRALANQMQEIRMLRHFKHGNIISMRECLHKGSFIYIALEYCSFSLNELLNDKPENKLHIVVARRFFHQLCHGLRYLHSLGIVHRDIKPDNLLLTNSGTLKIIDFGVSHILPIWSRDDLCSNYEGTPLFQAPEVVAGQAQYHGFKVDTWSSGVTLFLMLFGTYPFMDEALLGLYDKILGQDLEVPKKCPASRVLSQLLCTMLEKDCSRRASIDEVLEHPWLRLCHANLHDTEVAESSDFFDLVTSQGHVKRSRLKDVYRSMSVLPYLYRHHFPKLPTRKSKSRSGSTSTSGSSSLVSNLSEFRGHKVERINSISPTPMGSDTSTSSTSEAPSQLSHRELSSYNESSTSERRSSSSPTTSSPPPPPQSQSQGAAEDQDADRIEWGTEEQYQLMKVPPVRANRVRRAPMRRPLARSADKEKRRSPKASG